MTMDTTAVAQAAPAVADVTVSVLQTVLPFMTPASIVAAAFLWYFRDDVRALMASRGAERKQILTDVQALRAALEAHVAEEKGFWANQEDRVEKVEAKNHDLELKLTDIAATVKAQHEAVVAKLGELTSAVMESLRRPN